VTDIAFHFGTADKNGYVCRLLRKAHNAGSRVMVLADEETLAQLDTQLWAVSPTDFVPHCAMDAPLPVRARSLITFAHQLPTAQSEYDVLLNLHAHVPPSFDQFARLIEVVGNDEGDREAARIRWKHYTRLGYSITRHDLTAKVANA
jgi:DNA polymerase III subunit chi